MSRKWIHVAVIIVVGIAVVILMVSHRLNQGRMRAVMSNGRNIVVGLLMRESIDNTVFNPFPSSSGSAAFASSTDYFRAVVTAGVMNVEFSFFSAPGIVPSQSANAMDFTDSNNAWCIVADMNNATPEVCPYIFTKNLLIDSLDAKPQLVDAPPFGTLGLVVIQKNGEGLILKKSEIGPYLAGLGLTNKVLRP